MELPSDLLNHIKTFLPPHPLQREINLWSRRCYFNRWYFDNQRTIDKKRKIARFIDHNDFWIKMSNLNNEDAVKLKHKCFLDKKRMLTKLEALNIESYQCKIITHIPQLNKHGNYSEIFYNNQEIIY
jgi:hypothetical protein